MSIYFRTKRYGYNLGGGKETLNQLFYMDDLRLYDKNESQLESVVKTVRIFSVSISVWTLESQLAYPKYETR